MLARMVPEVGKQSEIIVSEPALWPLEPLEEDQMVAEDALAARGHLGESESRLAAEDRCRAPREDHPTDGDHERLRRRVRLAVQDPSASLQGRGPRLAWT